MSPMEQSVCILPATARHHQEEGSSRVDPEKYRHDLGEAVALSLAGRFPPSRSGRERMALLKVVVQQKTVCPDSNVFELVDGLLQLGGEEESVSKVAKPHGAKPH
ncbi:hypothetical protein PGTUg99_001135 [Puccinia graminis f. sp. tritici]|uniref:Uncharacterized protein n=1 Tax=Puccinia graminis f. sp. tritici TaxID=56615 RepID=A0A5B0QE31_PUCGR|nr:hypothetical protein PGTUg99_005807 [Puccinia graminis f. sp. tritici]KAA1111203.1 hypothetical protein PGTUg99_001135 [Puccinia graminis f. sp. tritici]